jgi:hypothetical protein
VPGPVGSRPVDELGHPLGGGIAFVGRVVRGTRAVHSAGDAAPVADQGARRGDGQVDGQRGQARVDREPGVPSQVDQRPRAAAEVAARDLPVRAHTRNLVEHDDPADQPGHQSRDERPAMEPVGVQAQGDGREELQDEDPAHELQVDRELQVEQQHHHDRAQLHHQRGGSADAGFLAWGGVGPDEFPVDAAREHIRRPDRHDRRRDQGADGQRGVGQAQGGAAQRRVEELRNDRVDVAALGLDAGRYRDEAEQREDSQHQRVDRQRRHAALKSGAVPRGEHARYGVRVEEQRERGTQDERYVAELAGRGQQQASARAVGPLRAGPADDIPPAALRHPQPEQQHQDGDQQEEVLDDGEQSGRPQPRVEGEEGQEGKGQQQRQGAAEAQRLEHHLQADDLQGDVGHGPHDGDDRDEHRQGP